MIKTGAERGVSNGFGNALTAELFGTPSGENIVRFVSKPYD
jgi:hypothetical protein